jgi:hypothetical protein
MDDLCEKKQSQKIQRNDQKALNNRKKTQLNWENKKGQNYP